MRMEPKHQLPRKSITVWRLYALIQTIILGLVAAGAIFATIRFDWTKWIIVIAIAVVVIEFIGNYIVLPKIRWKKWRYEVRDQEIEIQSGVFIVTRTLIPMIRVQHVDTEQGPILKKYNLSNISISSAATVHTIPMLLTEDADELRLKISELARVAEEDV